MKQLLSNSQEPVAIFFSQKNQTFLIESDCSKTAPPFYDYLFSAPNGYESQRFLLFFANKYNEKHTPGTSINLSYVKVIQDMYVKLHQSLKTAV